MTGGNAGAGNGQAGLAPGAHLRAWGVVGLIAQVTFTVGWVAAETWQGPRYSPVTDTISDMQAATAPHVWFPIACFAAGGIGTFCFAVFGLRPALAGAGRVAAFAPWMLALAGLAIGNSFPLIPCSLSAPGCTAHHQLYSPGGMTDTIVGTAALLVLAFTPGPLWERMKLLPAWRQLRPVMRIARIACPLCFILVSIASLTQTAEGLAERVLVTSIVLWIATLAITLIRLSGRARATAASSAGQMPTTGPAPPPGRPTPPSHAG
ncbi:MAG TPA: DUF998 domain-containing protein [Streptosporangiaceae bacterium]